MSAQPDHSTFRQAIADGDGDQPDTAITIPAILAAADRRPSGDGKAMARSIVDAWRGGERDVDVLTDIAVDASDRKQNR